MIGSRLVCGWVLALCAVAGVAGLDAGPALAQVPAQATAQRTSTSPDQRILAEFLDAQLARLVSAQPTERTAAREAIIALVAPALANQPAPTAQFFDTYANLLNQRLIALTSEEIPVQVRLNAAIVASRVAEQAQNARLSPVVVQLIDDRNEGVVLWGLRASRFVMPGVLTSPILANQNALIPAIDRAQQRYSANGLISIGCYEALTWPDRRTVNPQQYQQVVQYVLPPIQDILQRRVAMYERGVPPEPVAERMATAFLAEAAAWSAQNPQQQERTVQAMVNLISYAAQRATGAQALARAELTEIVARTAQALWVIGQSIGAPQLQQAVNVASRVGPATPNAQLLEAVREIYPAVVSIQRFNAIQPPAELPPPTAATPPAETTANQ
jgi:hypothetical protein